MGFRTSMDGPTFHPLRWFTRLLYGRTVLLLVLLLCAAVAGGFWNLSRLSSNLIESQALQNSKLYGQAITQARTLYSSTAVDRIRATHEVTVTDDYRSQLGAIPLPATFLIELGQQLSTSSPGLKVRLYSEYPFPTRQETGGAKDEFEREALRYLEQYPDRIFYRFETFQGRETFRYAQADIMQQSCVDCHNSRIDSPKTDWKVGDLRGVLEITQPIDQITLDTWMRLRGNLWVLVGVSIAGLIGVGLVIARLRRTSKELEQRVVDRTAALQHSNEQLAEEQQKSERLLLNILPEPIANRLKERGGAIADGFSDVTILFADIVNFTTLSEHLPPAKLISLLNEIFSTFDQLTEQYGLEKIKTIGDAYMVAGGIPMPRSDHAEAIAEMALEMRQELCRLSRKFDQSLNIRIGINTGPVVAGVIGKKKFIYDLWGDTVNIASRMESHGIPGGIQVTTATYNRLRHKYTFEVREPIAIKGKGKMVTYLLTGRLGEVAQGAQALCNQ